MSQARALSSDDVRDLRRELAAGATPTVWFTAAAVGVSEGRSGKVIALEDPGEGDFIQIRPAGSHDVLSFSSAEVTVVKPPRKRKEKEPPAAKNPPAAQNPPAAPNPPAAQRPAASQKSPATEKSPAPSATSASTTHAAAAARKPQTDTPAPEGARRRPRQPASAGATLTVTASPEGQWSVEVTSGKRRLLRPTPVSASAVAQAAKSLHGDVAEAVEPLIEAAREQQRSRVEQLQQELADAQRMLDELT